MSEYICFDIDTSNRIRLGVNDSVAESCILVVGNCLRLAAARRERGHALCGVKLELEPPA